MIEKCILYVKVPEAKEDCGANKLCAWIVDGIEGVIHGMCLLWKQHAKEQDWELLLITMHNKVNEENCTVML